jgi:hypothetical protein
VLPSSEDFDGLVTALEDAVESGEYEDLLWHFKNCSKGTQTLLRVPYTKQVNTLNQTSWAPEAELRFNFLMNLFFQCIVILIIIQKEPELIW